jgi:hypothetical protein
MPYLSLNKEDDNPFVWALPSVTDNVEKLSPVEKTVHCRVIVAAMEFLGLESVVYVDSSHISNLPIMPARKCHDNCVAFRKKHVEGGVAAVEGWLVKLCVDVKGVQAYSSGARSAFKPCIAFISHSVVYKSGSDALMDVTTQTTDTPGEIWQTLGFILNDKPPYTTDLLSWNIDALSGKAIGKWSEPEDYERVA